jgi:hypothetical protein
MTVARLVAAQPPQVTPREAAIAERFALKYRRIAQHRRVHAEMGAMFPDGDSPYTDADLRDDIRMEEAEYRLFLEGLE